MVGAFGYALPRLECGAVIALLTTSPPTDVTLPSSQLFLPSHDHTDEFIAYLSGAMRTEDGTSLKEVVVFRQPAVVHVYNILSHARRFYRSLIFSSDNSFCLHDMPCTLFLQGERPKLVAGDPRSPVPRSSSLLITRSLNKLLGTQTYIPSRLLRGQLPATLLENYSFWQNEDDSLTAYPRPFVTQSLRATRLQLTLHPQGDADQTGYGGAQVIARMSHPHVPLFGPHMSHHHLHTRHHQHFREGSLSERHVSVFVQAVLTLRREAILLDSQGYSKMEEATTRCAANLLHESSSRCLFAA
ncbi:MAG: hypothetical protein SGPRY_012474, partial [Prymnesium sp.]